MMLLIFAFVCFVLAALPYPDHPYTDRLIAAGLAFAVASQLFHL